LYKRHAGGHRSRRPTLEPEARRSARSKLILTFPIHTVFSLAYDVFDWNWKAAQAESIGARSNWIQATWKPRELLVFVQESVFGRFDSNIDLLHQMVERDPLDTAALRRLAWTLGHAGRLEESEASFRSLLRLNPSVSGGQIGLGTTLLYMGRFSEALAEVEKELEEDRRLCGLAIVYRALGVTPSRAPHSLSSRRAILGCCL